MTKSEVRDEEWRPVPGYEGLYEVSSEGRVKSLPREVTLRNGTSYVKQGKMLKPNPVQNRDQYTLYDRQGSKRIWKVSRLVLLSFIGSPPEGKPWALHWDDNPQNNHVENLRWGSPRENTLDSVRNGTHADSRKTHCPAGHGYTTSNTRVSEAGKRRCLTCDRDRQKNLRDRRKGRNAV